jgi:hypothetical protein
MSQFIFPYISNFNLGFILSRISQVTVIIFVYHYPKQRVLSDAFQCAGSGPDNKIVKFDKCWLNVLMDMAMKTDVFSNVTTV